MTNRTSPTILTRGSENGPPENRSAYVDPLFFRFPVESKCPFKDSAGVLTPCEVPDAE